MKVKTKILLIVGLALLLVCGGGSWFLYSNVRGTTLYLQNDALLVGDEILETLGKTWDIADLRDHASADFLAAVPEEDQKLAWLAKMKKELGAYKSGKSSVKEVTVVRGVEDRDVLGVDYTNVATFEKRKATIRLKLVHREQGGWQMATFDADPAQ